MEKDKRDILERAMAAIGDATPMKSDCGMLCGAACCAGGSGEGMLLFPGEEDLYEDRENFTVRTVMLEDGESALLAVCHGPCDREERPLGCRIFPLVPRFMKDGGIRARLDSRGRPVCPLTHKTVSALSAAFVRNVEEAFRILAEDEEEKAFLRRLAAQDAAVRHMFD